MSLTPPYKLLASPEIFKKYPDYNPVIFYVTDFDSSLAGAYCSDLLAQIQSEIKDNAANQIDTDPQISAWREYYKSFGSNPKRFYNSCEALLSRIAKGNGIQSIIPLVDLYNYISLKYTLPIGGENWDKLESDLTLKPSNGTESFDTRKQGEAIVENPEPDEIVWADTKGVTCRKWNWRQCTRTQLTQETKNIYFVIDFIGQDNTLAQQAKEELLDHLKKISPNLKEITNFEN
jgi:DNA/RNA-binding domain of Phe-tRNA-synthetase-like protein